MAARSQPGGSFWSALPRPLHVFGTLLFLDFAGVFAFAFIEPRMIFYCYEELDWTTVQFGVVVAVYGLLMVLGQMAVSQLSDRFGRKPAIVVGTLLTVTFYAGLTVTTSFSLVLLVAAVAGLGDALKSPALSAFYFDITAEQHRSRVAGIKRSASSLGGVAGPLLVAATSTIATSQTIFAIGGGLLLVGAILAAAALKEPHHVVVEARDVVWEVSDRRYMAAQAALRGIALGAAAEREVRDVV